MRTLFTMAILLSLAAPAAAQTADRLYIMDCGHNSAKDQSRWSPGVNVGKPIELSDMCVLIKHREQWLLWDTGYPDAVADQPVDTPVGHATRAKKLVAQLGELNLKPSDIAFVAVSHTHGDHPPKITLVSLAAVAERAQPLQRAAPSWRTKIPCSGCRRFTDRDLAHVRTPGGSTSTAQPLLRLARSPSTSCSVTKLNLVEPPGT
jgi:hypothetical protein